MEGAGSVLKPVVRSKRVDRILKKREPKLEENTKKALIMRGNSTSQTIVNVLTDLKQLTMPNSVLMSKKNEIFPFEDANSLEFLSTKNDCSLFAMGSHTKKRPNNLILGRTYDGHILDMFEFGVDSFDSLRSFSGSKKGVGSKPLMVFLGDQWDVDSTFGKIMNLLLDFFRADRLDKIALKGIDHVLSCTVADSKIFIRAYSIGFQKSGSRVPDVSLDGMGPFLDLSLRRTQMASEDLWKTACKQHRYVICLRIFKLARKLYYILYPPNIFILLLLV